MAYYRDGLKHPTQIWEAAAMHRLVEVKCIIDRCRNVGVFDPHALWWHFHRRNWSDTFSIAQHRFYCRRCSDVAGFRVKKAIMGVTSTKDVTRTLPFPTEREWKTFLSRHRG
jgi:hypothetical protein